MKFKINGVNIDVVEVNESVITEKHKDKEDNTLGRYNQGLSKIQLLDTLPEDLKRQTLIHELAHAYMYGNAHSSDNYDRETVCDLFGSYATDIVNITNKYFNKKKEK